MSIGCRIGPRIGPRMGVRIGRPPGGTSMAGVAQDATSSKFLPATAGQWTTTLAAAGIASGNPSALFLCQEAAGNLADSIGAFTMTAGGTAAAYQQTVAGWSAKCVRAADAATTRFSNADVALPDAGVGSVLMLGIFDMPTANPAIVRSMLEYGTSATRAAVEITTGGKLRGRSTPNTADGTANPFSAVRPLVLKSDFPNSVVKAYSDQEVLAPTFSGTMAGKLLDLFAVNGGQAAATSGCFYLAVFMSAAAQLSDAQVRTLLHTLAWTVAW